MDTLIGQMPVTHTEAKQHIQTLQGPALFKVLEYVAYLHDESLKTCSDALDETQLRRAQGEVKAFKAVMDLFEYIPVKPRRAVSRHLV